MRIGTIKASDVARYGRMDAEFHLVAAENADETARLEATMTPDEATAIVETADTDALRCLAPLVRSGGTRRRPDREDLMRAARETPHLALALLRREMPAAIARRRAEIAEAEAAIERMGGMAQGEDR